MTTPVPVPPTGEAAPGGRRAGPAARAACLAVRCYQRVFAGRPSPCRFWPSCSDYAIEALTVHGAARGGVLTVGRLARCHPWGDHGVDPVPERRPARNGSRATPDSVPTPGLSAGVG